MTSQHILCVIYCHFLLQDCHPLSMQPKRNKDKAFSIKGCDYKIDFPEVFIKLTQAGWPFDNSTKLFFFPNKLMHHRQNSVHNMKELLLVQLSLAEEKDKVIFSIRFSKDFTTVNLFYTDLTWTQW